MPFRRVKMLKNTGFAFGSTLKWGFGEVGDRDFYVAQPVLGLIWGRFRCFEMLHVSICCYENGQKARKTRV
jgi:hypothetical protein